MNFYPFHIGDYLTHTSHLSPMQDLVYRRIMDLYYIHEGPLEKSCERIAALIRLPENTDIVEGILREFFDDSPDGWRNSRCDEELERMLDKRFKAKASANARWKNRDAVALQAECEGNATNTNTNTNISNTDVLDKKGAKAPERKPRFNPLGIMLPISISPAAWAQWVEHRKAVKKPLNERLANNQIKFLMACAEDGTPADQVIDQSIRNGWVGLFPVKSSGKASARTTGAKSIYED